MTNSIIEIAQLITREFDSCKSENLFKGLKKLIFFVFF